MYNYVYILGKKNDCISVKISHVKEILYVCALFIIKNK